MTEANPQPLDYSGPSTSQRPPLSPRDRRRRLWLGFFSGLGVTGLAAAIGVAAGLSQLIVLVLLAPVVKVIAAGILAFQRDWRTFAGGLLLSSLFILLIFLGTCAVFAVASK